MLIRLTTCLALALAQASLAVTFDTTGSWNGTDSAAHFGAPNTTTYGQTFVAPGGDLVSFTFYLSGLEIQRHLELKAMVFAWTGTQATGAPLFTSNTIVVNAPADTFLPVTVSTGGVQLTTGASYVALFTVSDPVNYNASTGGAGFGATSRFVRGGDVPNDGDGQFVFLNNGSNFAALTAGFWESRTGDLVWKAEFHTRDTYQVHYFSNLGAGDSVINLTNSGASSTVAGVPGAQNGDICANLYAYSPDEQLVSCCSCNVTPNALNSVSVREDLASNTLTPIIPSALVVKVVVSPGGAACTASSAANVEQSQLTSGLLAWGTNIHALPVTAGTAAGTYGLTETPFAMPSRLSNAEFTRMTQLCAFIRANGSGYGICKSCKVGGLGAKAK